ncbi:hypothetical protein TVAG_322800 [Trichomonas vaginalis G3]|uniref:Importin N-terminal domain-containing protein n=1 Tax=Trichomonas vaginalis (strain ATCC PRA-98 / G3) TaxID=412133 RepID=A2EL32_TRIV3|nr:importin beta family [Trichomonas vaginalis G3]EAY06660.1 hypothetical protein TVAG_322800 [Trichomonas vaginalis G3]KAI5552863.1 importin beta family [Trichomonas vaginalis G3]|eukprot:XP_001318883.1 hypothetical protein [Trichomonas vaginalis G3]
MDDFTRTLLSAYEAQIAGNSADIEKYYSFIEEARQNPNIIQANISILQQTTNSKIKSLAAISLSQNNSLLSEKFENEQRLQIGNQIVELIAREQDYQTQRHLGNAFETLDLDDIAPTIIDFAQNAIKAISENNNQENQVLMQAALLLLRSKARELLDYLQVLKDSIELGLQLPQPITAYELAFNFGDQCLNELYDAAAEGEEAPEEDGDFDPALEAVKESEECTFFKTIFENTLQALQDNINNNQIFDSLYNLIMRVVGSEDPIIFVDPFLIINHFMPFIGSSEINISIQVKFANLINLTFPYVGVTESMMDSELTKSLFNNYLDLSGAIFNENPNDSLTMSEINIFDDFSEAFSQYPDFIDHVIEIHSEVEEQHYPGLLLTYANLFENQGNDYESQIPNIVELIQILAQSDAILARDIASYAIAQIPLTFGTLLDDYIEDLTQAGLAAFQKSLEDESSPEALNSLNNLFKEVSDTDPIFVDTYSFLVSCLESVDQHLHMNIFECIVSLISHASKGVPQNYDGIKSQLFSLLETCISNNTFLIPSIVDSISNMSRHCPDRFAVDVNGFMELIFQLLDQDDNDIRVAALHFIGAMSMRYKTNFQENFPALMEKLLEMGSVDTNANLQEEVQQRINMMNENMTFDLEEEDEDDNGRVKYSILATPAIALCELAALLMNSSPEIIAEYGERMIENCSVQMSSRCADALQTGCRALACFTEVIGKYDVNAHEWSPRIIDEALKILALDQKDPISPFSAVEVLISVVQNISAKRIGEDLSQIVNKVSNFMASKLPCCKYMEDPDLLDGFSRLLQALVTEYGNESVNHIGQLISPSLLWLTGKKPIFRQFALPVLGCFVEFDGIHMNPDDLSVVYQYALSRTMNNDPTGVWVLNEFTTGAQEYFQQFAEEVFGVLKGKLELKPKRAESFKEFMQRVVSVIGELQRNYYGDNFEVSKEQLSKILQNMPSTIDESENFGVARFFLWLFNKYNSLVTEEFARAGIRFLMMNDDEIGDQLLTADYFPQFVSTVGQILSSFSNRDQLISDVCGEIEEKINRVNSFFQ